MPRTKTTTKATRTDARDPLEMATDGIAYLRGVLRFADAVGGDANRRVQVAREGIGRFDEALAAGDDFLGKLRRVLTPTQHVDVVVVDYKPPTKT